MDSIVEILRCTGCGAPVELRAQPADAAVSCRLLDRHLACSACGTIYPITEDEIPIMWDRDIRSLITKVIEEEDQSDDFNTLSANYDIYEDISDKYYEYSRIDPRAKLKIKAAAERVLSRVEGEAMHLDFGCGPGQVIGWLKSPGLRQVGLDISLNNLRNARKHTGCAVVCANACNMPFAPGTFDLITESSALHHIPDWRKAVSEAIRVCRSPGGVVIDAEPTREQMALSKLAIAVFEARFVVYKYLSYFKRNKYVFRNLRQAKLNAMAEIHHQPGTGFPIDELSAIFEKSGHDLEVILSPSPELEVRPDPNWKEVLLSVLSLRDPWGPEFGTFTAISNARR